MNGLLGFGREDALRFDSLRNRVFRMIGKELEEDSYCKSYEGAIDIEISYPNYFEEEKPVIFIITLHCYILVNGRHQNFYGNTFREALDRFEEWIKEKEEGYAAD